MFCGTLQLCVYSLSYEYNNTTFTKTPMARIGSTQEVSIDFTTSLDKLGWYKTHSTPKKLPRKTTFLSVLFIVMKRRFPKDSSQDWNQLIEKSTCRKNFLWKQAIQLRKEVPDRSISQISYILVQRILSNHHIDLHMDNYSTSI